MSYFWHLCYEMCKGKSACMYTYHPAPNSWHSWLLATLLRSHTERHFWRIFFVTIWEPNTGFHTRSHVYNLRSYGSCFPLHTAYSVLRYIPYSLYYKKVLYKFFRLFDASSIQDFEDFLNLKPWKVYFGASSIRKGLVIESVL